MLNKEVLSPQVVEGFVPLLSAVGEDFVRRARAQVGKSGRERWTADFTHELFRFALECECPPTLKDPLAEHPKRATWCLSPASSSEMGNQAPPLRPERGLEGRPVSRQVENDSTLFTKPRFIIHWASAGSQPHPTTGAFTAL